MKTLAMLLALCSGCFVLPKTTTTTRDLGTEKGEIEHGAVHKVDLVAQLVDSTIEVTATAERACSRKLYRVIETKKEKHASYRPNKDARAGLFALVLAPVTIPISAIGTGIAVLADGDGETTTAHDGIGEEKFSCATPAAATEIVLQMPSGTTFKDITDDDGISRVRIPETEPYKGVIKVTTAGAASTELRYTLAMPAITAVRETVMTCSTLHHVSGKLEVQIGIDDGGRPTRIGVDRGDGQFAKCMNDGLANLEFSEAHRGVSLVLPFELPG